MTPREGGLTNGPVSRILEACAVRVFDCAILRLRVGREDAIGKVERSGN